MRKILAISAAIMIFALTLGSCKNGSLKSDQMSTSKDKNYSDQNNDNQNIKKLNMNYTVSHFNYNSNFKWCDDIAYCNGKTYIRGYQEKTGESTTINEIDLENNEEKQYTINSPCEMVDNVFIDNEYLYFTASNYSRDENDLTFQTTHIFKFNLSTRQNECTAEIPDGVANNFLLDNKMSKELYFIDMWGNINVYDINLNLKYTDEVINKISDYLGVSESISIEDGAIDQNGYVYLKALCQDSGIQYLVKFNSEFNVDFVMEDELNDLGGYYIIASLKDGKIAAYVGSPNETLVDIIDSSSGKVSQRCELKKSDDEFNAFGVSNDFDWIKVGKSSCETYMTESEDKISSYNLNDELYDILNSGKCTINNQKLYCVEDSESYNGEIINILEGDKSTELQISTNMGIMDNGNVIELDQMDSSSCIIKQYTPDGSETNQIIPDDINITNNVSIIGCKVNILISDNGKYKLYNTEGSMISEFEVPGLCSYVLFTEKNNEDFVYYLKDNKYYRYNIQNKKTEKIDIINDCFDPGKAEIYTGNDYYDLYFLCGFCLYGYNAGSQTLTEIISDTRALGIADIRKIIVAGDDGTLLCMAGNEENIIYVLNPSESSDTRTVINVAYVNAQCHEQVQKFNDNSDDYVINATDYPDISSLNLDISSGKIPDIMISDGGYYVKELSEKNMFTDMSDFFENDKEIKKDDYLENMLCLYKSGDITYQVFPGFSIRSVFTDDKTSDIKWDYSGFLDYVQKYGSKTLYAKYDKCNMLLKFMPYYYSDFVDIKNRSCDFDNETFKRMLELINNQECYQNYDKVQQLSSIGEGLGAVCISEIRSFTDFENLNQGNNTKINIKGFPGKEEGHSEILPQICLSISEKCKNKEVAWSFVRTFFLNDYQNMYVGNKIDGIPVKKSAYNSILQNQQSNGLNNYPELDNTIKSIKMAYGSEDSINKIITEETYPYFEGQASIDDVISALQNKVNLYLKEKY